jgi:hypothetical protein
MAMVAAEREHDIAHRAALTLDDDPCQPGRVCVTVRNLCADLTSSLGADPQAGRLLRSILRVKVIGAATPADPDLPDICGRHQVLQSSLRFVPHFPFDSGVRFCATFDPRPLGRPELTEVLTLEFSPPREMRAGLTRVQHVFPSGKQLPENLLRFYVRFSGPMQRGRAEGHVTLLDADGRAAPDALYRPPVELWDRSMTCLTILLDPGRLKRGLGPNRALGPPLKAGERYALAVGAGMLDSSGRPLEAGVHKSFQVTEAVRDPIAVEQWNIRLPRTNSRRPVELVFPRPLDWALLWRAITIESDSGERISGRITIDRNERRWTLTPETPWTAGLYHVRTVSSLEDVCGNTLIEAFDRPLRFATDLACSTPSRSIPFHLS